METMSESVGEPGLNFSENLLPWRNVNWTWKSRWWPWKLREKREKKINIFNEILNASLDPARELSAMMPSVDLTVFICAGICGTQLHIWVDWCGHGGFPEKPSFPDWRADLGEVAGGCQAPEGEQSRGVHHHASCLGATSDSFAGCLSMQCMS